MIDHRATVADALRAVEVIGPVAHAWFGVRTSSVSHEAAAQLSAETARDVLIYDVQNRLYADLYCAGGARPPLPSASTATLPGHSPFIHALSAANRGTGGREPGWTIVRAEQGAMVVSRDGLTLWAGAGEVYTHDGAAAEPGALVGVLMPNELLRLSPGFYMALGNAEFPVDGSEPVVRIYWNLRSECAAPLVAALTDALNRAAVAFRLKVVSDPAQYSRCDAGVLYVLRSEYERTAAIVASVHVAVRAGLREATPAMTKRLAPGLGLAEDPEDPMVSFGMSRCRLLAEGIVAAAHQGADEPAAALAVVERHFAQAGISLDAPYLNPGSPDRYAFPP